MDKNTPEYVALLGAVERQIGTYQALATQTLPGPQAACDRAQGAIDFWANHTNVPPGDPDLVRLQAMIAAITAKS